MTSLLSGQKQIGESGYYIPIASLTGQIYSHTDVAGNTGTGGGSNFSTATWAYFGAGASLSSIQAGAGLLRDMGRTIVSSLRTFRKVQVVIPNNSTVSTFGVGGRTVTGEEYFTGYIELGFEGNGRPAPVAHFGR
jgi:hypothetical protein